MDPRANDDVNAAQAALWNGPAGRGWVEAQDVLDTMFEPLQQRLVEAVSGREARAVLDIGCGTGGTTLALARALGPGARSVGVDLSEPMIAMARERARQERSGAQFVCADAQVHPFDTAAFDALVSRFGVMFFADPVAAFANLRRAARPGGQLVALAWRDAAENAFMTTAERAAAPLLPAVVRRDGSGPGQFAWADPVRVRALLAGSGWREVDLQPLDVVCRFQTQALAHYLRWVGPVGRELQALDAAASAQVQRVVREAFEPFVCGDEIRFTAACWQVAARAG